MRTVQTTQECLITGRHTAEELPRTSVPRLRRPRVINSIITELHATLLMLLLNSTVKVESQQSTINTNMQIHHHNNHPRISRCSRNTEGANDKAKTVLEYLAI
jgi:hypothetical protein